MEGKYIKWPLVILRQFSRKSPSHVSVHFGEEFTYHVIAPKDRLPTVTHDPRSLHLLSPPMKAPQNEVGLPPKYREVVYLFECLRVGITRISEEDGHILTVDIQRLSLKLRATNALSMSVGGLPMAEFVLQGKQQGLVLRYYDQEVRRQSGAKALYQPFVSMVSSMMKRSRRTFMWMSANVTVDPSDTVTLTDTSETLLYWELNHRVCMPVDPMDIFLLLVFEVEPGMLRLLDADTNVSDDVSREPV